MAVDTVIAIAVLSGKGGVGKSVISLNLALGLGELGFKTLLFDAAGGDLLCLSNNDRPEALEDSPGFLPVAGNVELYASSIVDSNSHPDERDIERFLDEIVAVAPGFEYVIFDCPTGSGPIPYTLAGLSEISILITTPDPTAIAGTYLLARSLYGDGLGTRCELLFNQVESADEAASLKTRFDILTDKFLESRFEQAGFIHNDRRLAESVLEQQPLLSWHPGSSAGRDFLKLSEKISRSGGLHIETSISKSQHG